MEIDKKDITVVIPLYNGEKTIIKVLDAINNQTGKDYIGEIIVVNDGSKDASRSLVEKYTLSSPIKINLINCINGGVSKARNTGLKQVQSKWVALCDSDDEWLSDKITNQVEIINRNSQIDFLGGNHVKDPQKYLFREIKYLRRITVKDLCLKTLPQTSTALFRKSIFDKIGGYDENQRYAEDGNFFMKIAANYNYYYDPKQVIVYGDGKSGFGDSGLSANILEMHKGLIKNFKEMRDLGYISPLFLFFSLIIEDIKYIRRKFIVRNSRQGKDL